MRCDMVTRAQMIEAIQVLPDDATIDDARRELDRLEVIELIDSRLAALHAGAPTLTHREVRRRMAHRLLAHHVENDT